MPNTFNRIFHGKNSKPLYFARNILRYIVPRPLLQKRLDRMLAELDRRPDKEYILDRAGYYCKLPQSDTVPAGLRPLSEHRFGRDVMSTYFFDSYEYTRWFDDSLLWDYMFGDVTTVPDRPAVVKSRPIAGDNARAVLLNLDKVRHFVFLRDSIPFRNKRNKAIFQLDINHKPHRRRFIQMYFGSQVCDCGIINPRPEYPAEWEKHKISMYDHLGYKYIMAIEGNDVATNLKWIMSTNSAAVMPRPTYETWFMEGRLIPNYHYIEISSDFSDLAERLAYYDAHPEEAEAIVRHAHEYISQFRDRRRERLISLLVLDRYFRATGQQR